MTLRCPVGIAGSRFRHLLVPPANHFHGETIERRTKQRGRACYMSLSCLGGCLLKSQNDLVLTVPPCPPAFRRPPNFPKTPQPTHFSRWLEHRAQCFYVSPLCFCSQDRKTPTACAIGTTSSPTWSRRSPRPWFTSSCSASKGWSPCFCGPQALRRARCRGRYP